MESRFGRRNRVRRNVAIEIKEEKVAIRWWHTIQINWMEYVILGAEKVTPIAVYDLRGWLSDTFSRQSFQAKLFNSSPGRTLNRKCRLRRPHPQLWPVVFKFIRNFVDLKEESSLIWVHFYFILDTTYNYVTTFVQKAISQNFDINFIWYNKKKTKKVADCLLPALPRARLSATRANVVFTSTKKTVSLLSRPISWVFNV